MKTIGRTNDGNLLVAMTEDEHRCLGALQDVTKGNVPGYEHMLSRGVNLDTNMADALEAVWRFVGAGFKINELQAEVDDLRHVLFPKIESK